MQQQDVAASKSHGMDAMSFVVAVGENTMAEHLEKIRFGIRSRFIRYDAV